MGTMLQEKWLHYLWQLQPWKGQALKTDQEQRLEILHPGFLNLHSGPDFTNARIRLNGLEWSGQIEIHIRASDWFKHGHQNDPAYNNVVLHVVYQQDQPVQNAAGRNLPALVLKPLLPEAWMQRYQNLNNPLEKLACQSFFPFQTEPDRLWTEQWVLQRLQRRAEMWKERLEVLGHHWEQLLWEALLRAQGQGLNGLPFQLLGRALPWNFVSRWRFDATKILALLLGQSGLLDASEPFGKELTAIHQSLQHALPEKPLPHYLWKFGRLRPEAWPTLKIARMAVLIQEIHPLAALLENDGPQQLKKAWQLPLHPYWQNHYHFGKTRKNKAIKPQPTAWHGTLINALAPLKYLRANLRNQAEGQDKALEWLQQLPAENNRITKLWKPSGIALKTALDSQAVLERYEMACRTKDCLNCAIGTGLLFGQF